MKKLSLFCAALGILALCSLPASSDTYVSGPVSGTWTAALSPYVVLGELEVPTGLALTIQPGVAVQFTGHYKLTVHGTLTAVGLPGDSIIFTRLQTFYTWAGIFIETASAPCELGYCVIEWSYAQGAIGTPQAKGGGVHVLGSTLNLHDCRISNNLADAKGGGLYLNYANGEISHTIFTNNTCYSDGGGIFVDNTSSASIHDCEIKNNTADNGAGIYLMYSDNILANLDVHHNNANVSNGGGIYMYHSSPNIHNSKINHNTSSSSYGSGLYCYSYSSPLIFYNEICFNNYTAIYCGDYSSPIINNCTVFGNNSYLIRTANQSTPSGINNIMLGSPYAFYIGTGCSVTMSYSNIQTAWPGQGNMTNAQPFFVNSYADDFNLMPYSPCIDHGSPSSPLDPDNTVADMGAHYFNQNQPQGICSITATPLGAPIVLPPSGGTVWFTVLIQNTPNAFNLFDGWYNLQQPDSQIVPMLLRNNLYLPASGNLIRTLSLTMNSTAMPGTYTVRTYVGDHPTNIEDWDSFTFVKSAGGGIGPEQPTVTLSDGEVTKTFPLQAAAVPQSTKLLGHYPDPFNPQTSIHFELSQAAPVKLEVFSVDGRKVATLLNRTLAAGSYSEPFDGSNLASGVYIYTLQAGRYHATGKMTLLK